MNYLFFDIECANCFQGKGKICSFGYVITDENFDIKIKEDLVINPKSKFHLIGRIDGGDIVLAYEKDIFSRAPDFSFFYDKIKSLLEDEENIVVGHATINDVNFIKSECERYKKPCINFKYYDSQILYKNFKNITEQVGLEKIMTEFGFSLQNIHKSDDDAYMTMLITKYMCEEKGLTLLELTREFPNTEGELKNFEIYKKISNIGKLSRKEREVVIAKFLKIVKTNNFIPNSFINGRKVCFSQKIEKRDYKQFIYILQRLYDMGGEYTKQTAFCDIFVYFENDDCVRMQSARDYNENGKNILVMDYMSFVEKLSITNAELEQADEKDLNYLYYL